MGWEIAAMCEIEKFPRAVLARRFPGIPILKDVKNLEDFRLYVGAVDVIFGGIPCQPYSVAGKQQGSDDDRDLWPAAFEIIKLIRPNWVVIENVIGFERMALDDVLFDLEGAGYNGQTFDIPACAIEAKHIRRRLWIIANNQGKRFSSGGLSERTPAQIANA